MTNSGPVSDPVRIDHTVGLLWDTTASALATQGRPVTFWVDVPRCMKLSLTRIMVAGLNTLATLNVVVTQEADSHRDHEGFHEWE